MRSFVTFVTLAVMLLVDVPGLSAAMCTAKDFAAAVDQSGASLRAITLEAQPKLQERLRRYQLATTLSNADYDNTALDAIQDATLDAYDKKSSALLLTVDSLGRVPDDTELDCAKLEEVKRAAAELNTVIKAKSDYMRKRLDEKITEAERKAAPAKTAASAAAQKQISDSLSQSVHASSKVIQPQATAAKTMPAPRSTEWAASTKPGDASELPRVVMSEPDASTPLLPSNADGYTIEEIRDATRGFFGTISTNLAGVIEHAFKQSGRPTAYVLGTEGGGAFLAGLRFGEGTLYMRSEPGVRKVYWHGPSLGTDFGAAGSRTLFLIYRMQNPNALYRNFTGIDGSAYFVGGVGLTLLKGGPVIMAPIRSGIGVRLGTNLGYLRFTDRPTWNPF